MELSGTQKRLYDYLAECLGRDGKTPSLRQIAADMGVSHTAVAQLLGLLEKKGVVERDGRYSRSLRIVAGEDRRRRDDRSRELPIIGQITAGLPMYAQQEWDGSVIVDRRLCPGDNLFCLRVRGRSMRDAGILHGDLAICEPRQYAANGEIVAVLIQDEEATIKRFFLQPDHIELRPENPEFPVMRYPFGEVLVQGKVIGVIRCPGGILATGQRVA